MQQILPERAAYKLCGSPVRELFIEEECEREALEKHAKELVHIELDSLSYQWTQVRL